MLLVCPLSKGKTTASPQVAISPAGLFLIGRELFQGLCARPPSQTGPLRQDQGYPVEVASLRGWKVIVTFLLSSPCYSQAKRRKAWSLPSALWQRDLMMLNVFPQHGRFLIIPREWLQFLESEFNSIGHRESIAMVEIYTKYIYCLRIYDEGL